MAELAGGAAGASKDGAPVASLGGVGRRYGRQWVFAGVDFEVRSGITALLGANGAGKTTLLDVLSMSRPPDSGQVWWQGSLVATERAARRARSAVAYLPQQFTFPQSYTAADAVVYAAWLRSVSGRVDVAGALAAVGLGEQAGKKVSKMSGGMRQRLGLATCLVGDPKMLILDEPTVGLDPAQRVRFRRTLAASPIPCTVLSTHLVEDVVAMADRVMVLHGGGVVFRGSVAQLEQHDRGGIGDTSAERGYMHLIGED